MRKRVFVLGGTGFIGSEVLKVLRAKWREYDVMVLAHHNVPYQELESFNLFIGDLRTFNLKLLDDFQPDYIIHTARISGKGKLGRYLAATKGAKANERIIRHLIHQSKKKPHVIYVSGTLVYGDCREEMVSENSAINPTGFAKEYIIAERPWMKAVETKKLPVNILRPPWVIGKASWFEHFFINPIRSNKHVPVYGEGNNWMSLLDVEDCAGMIVETLKSGVPGRYYNLCVPNYFMRQMEFGKRLSSITNLPLHIIPKEKVIRSFNRTVYESFSFSVKLISSYADLYQSYKIKYPTSEAMIKHNLEMTDLP